MRCRYLMFLGTMVLGSRPPNAALQAVRMGPSRYRLYLIDPGFLDPADRDVTVHVQVDQGLSSVRDVLGGEDFPMTGKSFSLKIPAGTFRIVDARF